MSILAWIGVGLAVFVFLCIITKGKILHILGDILEAIFSAFT